MNKIFDKGGLPRFRGHWIPTNVEACESWLSLNTSNEGRRALLDQYVE